MQAAPPADVCSGPGEGAPCSPLCHAGGVESGPETPQRFWVLGPSIWAPHPAWVLQGPYPSRSLCAELLLDFLPHLARVRKLQRAGVSCLSWLQADPGDPSTLACHWLCHLPSPTSHPVCWGQDLFQEQKWDQERAKGVCGEQDPPWWCPSWQGLLREQLRGSAVIPSRDLSSLGTPGRSQSAPQAQDPLCMGPMGQRHSTGSANDTFIFFFKSPLPNCSILWRGWAVATALRDSPAELYNPGPVTSPSRLHPCHGRLWGHVLSPPLPMGAAPCQGQAARLLRVSISA